MAFGMVRETVWNKSSCERTQAIMLDLILEYLPTLPHPTKITFKDSKTLITSSE